jgi:hypothetical protein
MFSDDVIHVTTKDGNETLFWKIPATRSKKMTDMTFAEPRKYSPNCKKQDIVNKFSKPRRKYLSIYVFVN